MARLIQQRPWKNLVKSFPGDAFKSTDRYQTVVCDSQDNFSLLANNNTLVGEPVGRFILGVLTIYFPLRAFPGAGAFGVLLAVDEQADKWQIASSDLVINEAEIIYTTLDTAVTNTQLEARGIVTNRLACGSFANLAAPVYIGIADQTVVEDSGAFVVNLLTAFFDPDTPTSELVFTATETGGPLLDSITLNPLTGQVTIVPTANANGLTTIEVSATDPEGNSITGTFDILIQSVSDGGPVIVTPIPDITQELTLTPTVVDMTPFFTDPDLPFDTLTFTVIGNTNPTVASLGLAGAVGTITPTGNLGSTTFTVQVTDSTGLLVTDDFVFTVTSAGPVFNGIPPITINEDSGPFDIDLWAAFDDALTADIDLIFTFIENSGGTDLIDTMVFNPATGLLSVTPLPNAHGVTTIDLTALDLDSNITPGAAIVMITSISDGGPVVISPIPDNLGLLGQVSIVDLSTVFTDPDLPFDTLTYSLEGNTDPSVCSAVLVGGILTSTILNPGTTDITVRATDSTSLFADDTFECAPTIPVIAINRQIGGMFTDSTNTAPNERTFTIDGDLFTIDPANTGVIISCTSTNAASWACNTGTNSVTISELTSDSAPIQTITIIVTSTENPAGAIMTVPVQSMISTATSGLIQNLDINTNDTITEVFDLDVEFAAAVPAGVYTYALDLPLEPLANGFLPTIVGSTLTIPGLSFTAGEFWVIATNTGTGEDFYVRYRRT